MTTIELGPEWPPRRQIAVKKRVETPVRAGVVTFRLNPRLVEQTAEVESLAEALRKALSESDEKT